MANLSDANGTFTLINAESLTKDEINETLKMLKELSDGEYITEIHCNLTNTDPDLDMFIDQGYSSPFFGIGRWIYEENIKYMFEWIQQDTKQYNTLLSKLNQNNIQFQFEYIDYEPGAIPDHLENKLVIARPYFNTDKQKFETEIMENYNNKDVPINVDTLSEYGYIDDTYLTLDDFKNKTDEVLVYFEEDEIMDFLEENEDEFEDADGTINVYVPENEIFVPLN